MLNNRVYPRGFGLNPLRVRQSNPIYPIVCCLGLHTEEGKETPTNDGVPCARLSMLSHRKGTPPFSLVHTGLIPILLLNYMLHV